MGSFIKRYKSFLILMLLVLYINVGCGYNSFIDEQNKYENPYFFTEDQVRIEYEGFFVPLSCREIEENIHLNIIKIKEFEDEILYALELDQLETTEDPLDEIRMGGRYLGYFYVTPNTIYRMPLPDMNGFTSEQNEKIIRLIQESKVEFLSHCTVVCNEEGTEDIADENGWHEFVEVDGDKRIFHMYNDYAGGTKEYENIVWEKGKGIIYYMHGSGSMLMHVEFGVDLNENHNVLEKVE